VEAESKKIGERQVPPTLFAAMHAGVPFRVEAPMDQRVKLWREDYSHFEENPDALIEQLQYLRALVGNEEFELWKALTQTRQMPAMFERIMISHYDPAYRRSTLRHYPGIDRAQTVTLENLARDALLDVAQQLAVRQVAQASVPAS
jgi:tRNA 2-selenouridine synthase